MKRILCITALVCVAMLAFSVADVEPTAAQTTVKILIPDSVAALSEDSVVVVTNTDSSIDFTGVCMKDQGFTAGQPIVNVVIRDSSRTPPVVRNTISVTNVPVRDGTRLVNLVMETNCTENGITYRIYSADVAGP